MNDRLPSTRLRRLTRRQVLASGLGAAGLVALGAPSVEAFSLDHFGTGSVAGLVVTDLEVVTVTDTSVTFSWACYDGPHLPVGGLRPSVPSDSEVRMGPADASGPLPVVHWDDTPRPFHLVTITGLEPNREYRFECRSRGVVARPGLVATNQAWSPERRGRVRTLTPPPGDYVTTIALINDTHIGEERHGILVAGMPEPIVQEPGLDPFPDIMLAGALAEVRSRGVNRVLVNGDTTSEARPAEVRRFRELMDSYGQFGVDYFVTRGNHDRPHTPASDPDAGYEQFPVLPGTEDHRDVWGAEFVPRQEHWTTSIGGLRVLGIDTAMLDASGGEILPHQMDAIADELRSDPHRPTLALAHHPVTREAAWTNMAGPGFVLNEHDANQLQDHFTRAPGVFMMAAGHTHRARRTSPDAAQHVDFVETGSNGGYPGGYTLLHLYTGGYMMNFHRIGTEEALRWSVRSRWAGLGVNPEYTLGTTDHRNYVVHRDLTGIEKAPTK